MRLSAQVGTVSGARAVTCARAVSGAREVSGARAGGVSRVV
jgi:hypothetical protein